MTDDNRLFFKYRVVVGNVGTVCETNNEEEANDCYNIYVEVSVASTGKRASGEAVTLFEDGEPSKEHLGYQYMYENCDGSLNEIVAIRRSDDPGHCPICPAEVVKESVLAHMEEDLTVTVARKCTGCGFPWKDVYRVVDSQIHN